MSGEPRVSLRREEVGGAGPEIPVLVVEGRQPGPCSVVVANLHGDECTGIGAAFALAEQLVRLPLAGTVHLFPTLNPDGMASGSRRLPGDALDPNRAFPGDVRGSPARRHAARVWGDILGRAPELVVDLHTDSDGAVPYSIVDRVVRGTRKAHLAARCHELAAASGLSVLREYPPERYLRFELHHSLPGALINGPGIPAITLEIGPRRRIDPGAVDAAVAATLGVLSALGQVSAAAPAHPTRVEGGPWRRESGPRTSRTGVLLPLCMPGQRFARHEPLAQVRALDGTVRETLRAAGPGWVVALPESCHVAIGASVATLAVPDIP